MVTDTLSISDTATGAYELERTAQALDDEVFQLKIAKQKLELQIREKETQRDALLMTANLVVNYQRNNQLVYSH